jgi:hypothetical protein
MARKARKLTALMVRLPEPLRRELAQLAAAGGRSMNSEIIRRLEASVELDSPLSPDAERVLARVEEGMKKRDQLESELMRALFQAAPQEFERVLRQATPKRGRKAEEGDKS